MQREWLVRQAWKRLLRNLFYIPLDPGGWVILRAIYVGVIVVKIARVNLLVLPTRASPHKRVVQVKSNSDEK